MNKIRSLRTGKQSIFTATKRDYDGYTHRYCFVTEEWRGAHAEGGYRVESYYWGLRVAWELLPGGTIPVQKYPSLWQRRPDVAEHQLVNILGVTINIDSESNKKKAVLEPNNAIMFQDEFCSCGLGRYFLNQVTLWLKVNHLDVDVSVGTLGSADSRQENWERRDRFYREPGFYIEYYDREMISGYVGPTPVEQLKILPHPSVLEPCNLESFFHSCNSAKREKDRLAKNNKCLSDRVDVLQRELPRQFIKGILIVSVVVTAVEMFRLFSTS